MLSPYVARQMFYKAIPHLQTHAVERPFCLLPGLLYLWWTIWSTITIWNNAFMYTIFPADLFLVILAFCRFRFALWSPANKIALYLLQQIVFAEFIWSAKHPIIKKQNKTNKQYKSKLDCCVIIIYNTLHLQCFSINDQKRHPRLD